ncbi:TPA: amidase [Citrobacter freundii]|uniref:amidase family protein n=1 Tax=Gammaproteobacteria TaxID=1236 RepID=UPI000792B32C|nr:MULTISPECIES: amidase [Gammaproteobacteria]MBN5418823.1 amidase [Serratia marcescens]HBV8384424.1 amidase [Citrobacter freundii]RQI36235.1 amidase [Pseudomonas aeruginosa]SAF37825.1 amidase [Enterobacter hormaechei]HDY6068320.1 amidase [Pseudomonas aeruginosa]
MTHAKTEDTIAAYLATCGPDASIGRQQPEYLELALRERHARLEADPTLAAEWAAQYEQWRDHADGHYRCLVSTRPVEAPWYRLGVKDTVDVAGLPTRLGLHSYRHYPARSAKALAWLDKRVALTCKVASTELNIAFGGGCRNPRFPTIDPSGSSTGSAVSVAAGLCDISLGTDVLGSVRWPASHCGMVGLRMTQKTENLPGVFPLSPRMDALGWVTRSADDLDFIFPLLGIEALLGQQQPLKQLYRVGFLSHVHEPGLTSAQMLHMLDKARTALAELGMAQTDVEMPELWASRGDAWQLCARDAWLASAAWQQAFDCELHWSTRSALEVGAGVSDSEYHRIHQRMDKVRAGIDAWFDAAQVDFVVFPMDPNRPFDLRNPQPGDSTIPSPCDRDYAQKISFTPLASFSGLPAITVPITQSPDGKASLAVQIMGRRDSEQQLLDIAKRLQATIGLVPAAQQSN